MKQSPLLLLTAAALAVPGSAQSFDLIVPTTVRVDNLATSVGVSGSLLVNTGADEIDPEEWSSGYFWSESLDVMTGQVVRPSVLVSTPVAPGTAVGSGNAEMLALLDSSETLASQVEEPLALAFGGDGEFTTTVTAVLQVGDQRATFSLQVEVVEDALEPGAVLGAQRVSSFHHPSPYEVVAAGCPVQGIELTLQPHGQTNLGQPLSVGLASNLPFIGNEGLRLQPLPALPAAAGSPFLVVAGLAQSPDFTLLGCDFGGFDLILASGVLSGGAVAGGGAGLAPFVPVPLPDNSNWVGLDVVFQWLLLTPLADNGAFTASEALQMTIEMP